MMIRKKNNLEYRNKEIGREEEEEIYEIWRNKFVVEKVENGGEFIEITRPLFFIEAKEEYFGGST